MPTERFALWRVRPRLPLGDSWAGTCTAPGNSGVRPSDQELRDFCNLGFARGCARLPKRRQWDAVRFAVSREREGKIVLSYVCEVNYRPGEQGALEYDLGAGTWRVLHGDPCIQKMAQCFLEAHLERKGKSIHQPSK